MEKTYVILMGAGPFSLGSKEDRRARYERNITFLNQHCRYPFEVKSNTVLFRLPGAPWIDFYPSTDRWRIVGPGVPAISFRGTARDRLRYLNYHPIVL